MTTSILFYDLCFIGGLIVGIIVNLFDQRTGFVIFFFAIFCLFASSIMTTAFTFKKGHIDRLGKTLSERFCFVVHAVLVFVCALCVIASTYIIIDVMATIIAALGIIVFILSLYFATNFYST